ncbi:hypothetical protein [Anaerocolumna xylanovorans]|uniref:RES domain-containing protein n=1 Tax=Anaerocolumna xylanovorans DSM 12503 TaxID=1121345 RepID=A0A1M7YLJ8_9FIRM|nr:hypothetical protein [Anaerocolumna xylanovorans]SHO53457.1 hypothetical protein SAMN02745217_04135 [Anaerocolumna xylanovorans DSM 12503]
MIISKNGFISIANKEELDLPKRWDGIDFHSSLSSLYEQYFFMLTSYINPKDLTEIQTICNEILNCIDCYHNGLPNKAFLHMDLIMNILMKYSLAIYKKTGWSGAFEQNDPLMLYRIRNVQNNINYNRKDIFHTPYNLRSKVSTCRYSISGYPCLYLGTSLELCCEEAKIGSLKDLPITSRFKLERNLNNFGPEIDVIELAIKPKDFIFDEQDRSNQNTKIIEKNKHGRNFKRRILNDIKVMNNYLYWYPLIAACSFIRVNKQDPFASEYIIPQLLMQWIRNESTNEKLIGIRYFSCASERASELGFNYVFPASGEKDPHNEQYCRILTKSFKLTKPIYIHEFNSVYDCELQLKTSTDFDYI